MLCVQIKRRLEAHHAAAKLKPAVSTDDINNKLKALVEEHQARQPQSITAAHQRQKLLQQMVTYHHYAPWTVECVCTLMHLELQPWHIARMDRLSARQF